MGIDRTKLLMNQECIALEETNTVEQAILELRKWAQKRRNIYCVHIVDQNKRLICVLPVQQLLAADNKDLLSNIVKRNPAYFPADQDRERTAKVSQDQYFGPIPISIAGGTTELMGSSRKVDKSGIVQGEGESISGIVERGKEIDFHTGTIEAAGKRLPWIILVLIIGLVSGAIVQRFEETLEAVVALAFFMPMIAGMSGNTGTQSFAVVVRGLVLEKLDWKRAMKLLWRDFWIGMIIGLVCAIILAAVVYVWSGNLMLGFVVSISLLATLIIGTVVGTIIPLILYKCKADPAVASGPLITTINDILALFIYFGIASMFISKIM